MFHQIQGQGGGQGYRDNEGCSRSKGNVKAEVKRNGKGKMKTLGPSAAEGIERASKRAEANMRGA